MQSNDKIVLGYWAVRGKAQVARLLLSYTGAVWEDKLYTEHSEWYEKDKLSLDIPFINLPYLIDGDFKLAESTAINKYIVLRSEKKELLGKDIKEQARVESLLGVLADVRSSIANLFWDEKHEEHIPQVLEKIEPKLKELEEFYDGKDFALGYLTLADFHTADNSYFVERISLVLYEKYPFLKRTRDVVESLPEIKKYYESENSVKGPFLPEPTSMAF